MASVVTVGQAQWAPPQRQLSRPQLPGDRDDGIGAHENHDHTLSRKMLKASYEQLQKDIQHLSDLAAELKEDVTKGDEDVLSLSEVKKAEEIEKLAKKIQGRMKNL